MPGLKSISSLDPMFVKRIAIHQDFSNPISINLDLNNVTLSGLSAAKAKESRCVLNIMIHKLVGFLESIKVSHT